MLVFTVAALLTVGTVLFTLLVRSQDIPEAPPVSPTQYLEERKARIYENLRDLQFEYRLGKLSDEDYQKTKQGLQRELAATLAEIDAAAPAAPAPTPAKVRVKPDGKTCPHCGAKFPSPLKFCGECGKAMT
jgi:hypothetical protein